MRPDWPLAHHAGSMSSFIELFSGREDRERVLTEIVSSGLARCGVTLIAHVERATLEVLAVRSIPTPEPFVDGVPEPIGAISSLSHQLCAMATDIVPARTWTGDRWGPITGELVTVVCREGEAAISPVEEQFFWGWRYSNHLTAGFHGDVYVVTPGGWAGLLAEWSGCSPVLPVQAVTGDQSAPGVEWRQPVAPLPASPDDAGTAIPHAGDVVADSSGAPRPGECLLCYVSRMVLQFGCDNHLRFARQYRDARAPRATGLERRLANAGGFCDCEVLLNAYDLRPEHWLPALTHEEDGRTVIDEGERSPDSLPACTGVSTGSTQPCGLWQ
ncbi:DUF2695 domain-containing protein [Raineyella antarctica]|nr:DUF2695 domain-containing protein [Raineyella antarctica]